MPDSRKGCWGSSLGRAGVNFFQYLQENSGYASR